MGAGKTTLGKRLAKELGVQFIDLDWYIESRFHKTISEIFSERGESGFREIERNMLHEAGAFDDVIVSAGGGTPCFFDNIDFMNANGQTVFLDAGIDVLFSRLRVAKQQRPILKDKSDDELRSFIVKALGERMPFYSKANYRFCADELESRGQIAASVKRLREQLGL
jgi:shikimate kinase